MASSSAPLKKYIGQVDAATDRFDALKGEIASVIKILSDRSSSSAHKQTHATDVDTDEDEDDDSIDPSSPQGQELLKFVNDLQKAIVPFRNFNPVPRSATQVDKEFVDFSLKAQQGLDMLRVYLYAQDNDELGERASQKMEEAIHVLQLAVADIHVLEHMLQTQSIRKTYVPG